MHTGRGLCAGSGSGNGAELVSGNGGDLGVQAHDQIERKPGQTNTGRGLQMYPCNDGWEEAGRGESRVPESRLSPPRSRERERDRERDWERERERERDRERAPPTVDGRATVRKSVRWGGSVRGVFVRMINAINHKLILNDKISL